MELGKDTEISETLDVLKGFSGECVSVYNGSMRWERAVCGVTGGSFSVEKIRGL